MKYLLIIAVVFIVLTLVKRFFAGGIVRPAEAARRVADGSAVLVDVREPDEWSEGVVTGAVLLSLSDLRGARAQWRPFLDINRDKQLILYCRAGTRAGMAARLLAAEGFATANAGGFSSLAGAGLPVRKPHR
ncbi:MAG: rhodanese-like domain-containing protein [Opitutaceae bacterium]|jgi:rhodanese-related sulfurtransferase